jgi:hypothetical protein
VVSKKTPLTPPIEIAHSALSSAKPPQWFRRMGSISLPSLRLAGVRVRAMAAVAELSITGRIATAADGDWDDARQGVEPGPTCSAGEHRSATIRRRWALPECPARADTC